ncbi:MAG: hypothetical protein ACYC5O_03005 [Anaerolineae bacterium]
MTYGWLLDPKARGRASRGLDVAAAQPRGSTESIAGFERAYRITFYAAIVALFLGALLPGWPRPWAGRRAAGAEIDPPRWQLAADTATP